MRALMFLIYTSVVLGVILGGMAMFIFYLSAVASIGIAIVTMIGLFLINLVLNNITFNRRKGYLTGEQIAGDRSDVA